MLLSRIGSMAPIGGLLTNTVTPVVTDNWVNLLAPADVVNTSGVKYSELNLDGTNIINAGSFTIGTSSRCGITVLDDAGDITQNYFYTKGTTSVEFRDAPQLASNGSYYGFAGIGGTTPTLIRFNGFGQITFAKRYNVSTNAGNTTMGNFYATIDSSNNIYFVCAMSLPSNNRVVILFKVDSNGNLLWQTELDTSAVTNDRDTPWFIRTDSSNNVYILGGNNQATGTSSFIKLNSSGTIQFAVGLDNTLSTHIVTFTDMIIDGTDFYVIGNNVNNTVTPNVTQGIIAKYNSSGVLQWQKLINDVSLWEIKQEGSRIFYNGIASGTYAASIVGEVNSSGTVLWQNKLSGYTNQFSNQVSLNVGELVVADNEINMSSWSQLNSTTGITTLIKVPDDGSIPGSGTYGFFSNQFAVKYQASSYSVTTGSLTPLNISYTVRNPSVSVTDETGQWTVNSSSVTNYKKYI